MAKANVGMNRILIGCLVGALGVACACRPGEPAADLRETAGVARWIASPPLGYYLESVVPSQRLVLPVLAKADPVERGRWWVVEQAGRLVTFTEEDPEKHVVLDIGPRLLDDPNYELGFLGFTLHPDYPAEPLAFIYYTADPETPSSSTTAYLSRLRIDPATRVADLESETVLQRFHFSEVYHHGGSLEFGPDGYLYVGLGDGGRQNHGQNTLMLLGSLLRIDVDGDSPYAIPPDNPLADGLLGRPEIYAWGFRNLWKFTFDRLNGDLWGGDVGAQKREEMNRIVDGGNYGWPRFEGALCMSKIGFDCNEPLLPPVVEYTHDQGRAVIGGYVYRGKRHPSLWGHLLYADFGTGRVWSLDVSTVGAEPRLLLEDGELLTSFAEDLDGEIYLLRRHGRGNLMRLEPPTGRGPRGSRK